MEALIGDVVKSGGVASCRHISVHEDVYCIVKCLRGGREVEPSG